MKISLTPNSFTSNKCIVKNCKSFKFGSTNVCDKHYYNIKFEFNKTLTTKFNLLEFNIINNFNQIIKKKNLKIKLYHLINLIYNKQKSFKNRYKIKIKASNLIKENIRNYIIKKKDYEFKEECTICFEEIKPNDKKTLYCSHNFHKECISKWLEKNNSCPYCRMNQSYIDKINFFLKKQAIEMRIYWDYSYSEIINKFNSFWEETGFHKNNNNYLIDENHHSITNYHFFSPVNIDFTDKLIISNIVHRFKDESFNEELIINNNCTKNLISKIFDIIKSIKKYEINNESSYIIKELIIKNQLNINNKNPDYLYEFSLNFNKIENVVKTSNINKIITKDTKIVINDLYISLIYNIYYEYDKFFLNYKKIIENINNFYLKNRYDTDFKYDYIFFKKLKNKPLNDEIIIDNIQYFFKNFPDNNYKKHIRLDTIQDLENKINNYNYDNYNDDILKLIEQYYYLITSKYLKIDNNKTFNYDMKFNINLEHLLGDSIFNFKVPVI